jgi:hypothetical protein
VVTSGNGYGYHCHQISPKLGRPDDAAAGPAVALVVADVVAVASVCWSLLLMLPWWLLPLPMWLLPMLLLPLL